MTLDAILSRFETLYPLLIKQRAKLAGAGYTQNFISASNRVSKEATAAAFATSLPILDKLKLMSTLVKSEVAACVTDKTSEADLSYAILPQVDQICQTTAVDALISDKGIFLISILMRLQKFIDQSICKDIILILLKRAQNYLIVRAQAIE